MYKISDIEKEVLKNFKRLKIPQMFKTEYIDHMLFIELVDFDICTYLLEGKKFPNNFYAEVMQNYDQFKKNIDISNLDEWSKKYYYECIKVLEIFEKHCNG